MPWWGRTAPGRVFRSVRRVGPLPVKEMQAQEITIVVWLRAPVTFHFRLLNDEGAERDDEIRRAHHHNRPTISRLFLHVRTTAVHSVSRLFNRVGHTH